MSVVEIEKLLSPLGDESPCGEDLEYDPAFLELDRMSRGKPEQQMGESVIPAEEPDWKGVQRGALELFGRTRDLRVAVLLTGSLVRTSGYPGLADGLAVVRGLLERYWDGVHPALDPSDPDPVLRVNTLSGLNAFDTTLKGVQEAPLVASRAVGRFGWRDVLVATAKLPAPEGTEPPSTAVIEAAFSDAPIDDVKGTAEAVGAALESAAAIEAFVTEKVGAGRSVDLGELRSALKGARQFLAEQLDRLGVEGAGAEGEEGAPAEAGRPRAAAPGEIRSREDVVRALDRLSEYFQRNEPSSPVPLLLQRAKRLTSKNFLDIVRDLAPDGVAQVENIRGSEE